MAVYQNKRICFRHFHLGDYVQGTHHLKKDAIPSRFPRAPVDVVAACSPNVLEAAVVGDSTSHGNFFYLRSDIYFLLIILW
jgi:hypothetical protein